MQLTDSSGMVYLVGAGPGDEGLLTRKGFDLLQRAEVVVTDRLIGDGIFSFVPHGAERIDVGKNAGRHLIPQEQINQILIEKAREGKMVVRLKGGDPFLFGRGGEEVEALSQHGIPFEVVPGVTSAIAAASYAGIPVTHRDCCSSLHIFTGHGKKNEPLHMDYPTLARLKGTLLFLMSVSTIRQIADGLIAAGMDPHTHAAVIENGTTAQQRKFLSDLEHIADVAKQNGVRTPSLFVVGAVCQLSPQLDWFSRKPLFGRRVLITRPRRSAGKLSQMLKDRGADVTLFPCIETQPLDFTCAIDDYDWLLFTSANGVAYFFAYLDTNGMDCRSLHGKKIACVGAETAKELKSRGIIADFVPTVFDGAHMAREMVDAGVITNQQRGALLRAKQGAKDTLDAFNQHQIAIDDIAVYETLYARHLGRPVTEYDCVTFTSKSCVEGFIQSMGDSVDYTACRAICIGEQTAAAARACGMNVHVSDEATITSMVNTIEKLFER